MKKAMFQLGMVVMAGMHLTLTAFTQVGINTSGANPHSSAGLDVDFNDKGFLPPRMSTVERDAIPNPSNGLIIFNTSTGCPNYRQNGIWYEWCGTLPAGLISSLNCSGATHNGTLYATESAVSVSSVVPYSGGNGGTHSGQTVNSTGVTGLIATLAANTFAVGNGSLTYTITGTPSAQGTASFALNIGGQSCTLTRTVGPPSFVCGSSSVTFTYKGAPVTYGTVISANGKCWLDRNLGAAQVASSLTDASSYGDLFQWGRGDDGHQNRNSSSTVTLSSSDQPGNALFIVPNSSPFDWRSPQNTNLWQGVNGVNNPCPSGFRLPTDTEWNGEIASWSSNNGAGAFASPLKLSFNGLRWFFNNLDLYNAGSRGYYWSSSVVGTNSALLYFDGATSPAAISTDNRMIGAAVRCVQN